VIGSRRWRLADELSVDQASQALEPLLVRGPALLGDTTSRIPLAEIEAQPVASWLAVVRVTAPRFMPNPYDDTRLRAHFSLRNQSYNLSVSDRSPWVEVARRQHGAAPSSDWYLTVSLTEPYSVTSACHKLVAAAIEIPS